MLALRIAAACVVWCLLGSTPLRADEPGIAAALFADSNSPQGAILPQASVSDWPWWRGPLRSGVAADFAAPTSWSTTDHVVWKVAVPGRGHASPIVCADRVFVATADDRAKEQRL